MQPLTLCAYRVDAEPVFDALSAMDRQAFGVSDAELRWKWGSRRPSQVVLIDDERRLRSGSESA